MAAPQLTPTEIGTSDANLKIQLLSASESDNGQKTLMLGNGVNLGIDQYGDESGWGQTRTITGVNTSVYGSSSRTIQQPYRAFVHPYGDAATAGSFEFPYVYAITGPTYESNSANTYYPLSLSPGGFRTHSSGANIVIWRSYGHPGPAQNGGSSIGWTGSSSHQGGLYLSFRAGDSAWSDMFESQLVRHKHTYHTTVSDYGMLLGNTTGSGPFWVRLRGGFQYYVGSKHPCWPTWVTPGGPALTYNGNPNYQTWPGTTTSVANSTFNSNYTSDYV